VHPLLRRQLRRIGLGEVDVPATPEAWAAAHGLARYFGSSVKGEAAIDWDDPAARQAFLRVVVADADRLLDVARAALADPPADDPDQGRA